MQHDISGQSRFPAHAKMVVDANRETRNMDDAARQVPSNQVPSNVVGRGPVEYEAFLHLRRRASSPRWWPSAQEHKRDPNAPGASDSAW